MDSDFLFNYFVICFYIGSSGLVVASWLCPYVNLIFTNGKHVSSLKHSVWISKGKFFHIYAWGFITNALVYYLLDYGKSIPLSRILIAIHTTRRSVEVLISSKRSYSKLNLITYFYGIVFFTILPLATIGDFYPHHVIVYYIFPLASLVQCFVHLRLSRKSCYDKNVSCIFKYANHVAEFFIYLSFYLVTPSLLTFFMLVYVFLCMVKLMHLNYKWYRT